MTETRTIIIHGWSDCSESFVDIKKRLIADGIGRVETILYADYESREDNITFNDVIDGLNEQCIKNGLIGPDGVKKCDMNVIVHSTGGFVIRHWICRYYLKEKRMADCPVQRIVMLAPANFGSPLAHRGKSLLGSLVKGRWKVGDLLEVGRQLLSGLELGSPYQWKLAHDDLFTKDCCYNAAGVQLTILVGAEDYGGLRSWVNKPGTDGTVVISGTPLNSLKLVLDCCKPASGAGPSYVPYDWQYRTTPCDFAWAVLDGLDHGSIVDDAGKKGSQVHGLLLQALQSTDAKAFSALKAECDSVTKTTYGSTKKPCYQQFLIHAVDDQNESIPDFTMEFYVLRKTKGMSKGLVTSKKLKDEEELSEKLQSLLTDEFHTHTGDPSYRRLLIDCDALDTLHGEIDAALKPDAYVLAAKVFVPAIDGGIRYRTEALQTIVIYDSSAPESNDTPSLFYPNTTTLLELRVDRYNDYVTVGPDEKKH